MHYNLIMTASFEVEKNRKAFMYTLIIVGILLLLAVFWTWIIPPPPKPLAEDIIEINLGNMSEGFGEIQPLIKGEKSPGEAPAEQPKSVPVASNNASQQPTQEDDSKDVDAMAAVKPTKVAPTPTPKPAVTQPVKNTTPVPTVVPEPKPQKPKIAGYSGPKGGTGNGSDINNGYTYQGNNPNGKGDGGSPNGKPDSYGNTPGGKTGGSGLRVSKGDRTIINNYIFMGDLPKATINAVITVSPDGRGSFVTFDKGSTSTDSRYATAIRSYLPNIKFNPSDHTSTVTVPFNFKVQ
jgi:hypothetical protein